MRCMAFGTVLLKPHVCHINTIQLRHKEVCNHVSVPLTIDRNVLAIIIFKDIWTKDS